MSQVRLIGDSSSHKGALEVYLNGVWGSVCPDNFGRNEARVVCRQLGYYNGADDVYGVVPATTPVFFYQNLHCDGDEENLENCYSYYGFRADTSCNDYIHVPAVTCAMKNKSSGNQIGECKFSIKSLF